MSMSILILILILTKPTPLFFLRPRWRSCVFGGERKRKMSEEMCKKRSEKHVKAAAGAEKAYKKERGKRGIPTPRIT